MKKVLILSIVLAMAFAFASCGGNEEKEVSVSESKTVAIFEDINETGKIHMKVSGKFDGEEITAEIALEEDKSYFASETGEGEGIVISKDGKMWILDPATKTGTVVESTEEFFTTEDLGFDLEETKEYADEKMETGTVEVNGETYDYEEFFDDTEEVERTKFVFDGKKLVYIITETKQNEETVEEIIKVEAFDADVDDSLFEVPAGYDIVEM